MREHAHHLLDCLEASQLSAVVHLLETMVSPTPPGSSDTLSAAERQAIAEADEWLNHNDPIANEEILADFGLTSADWDTMGADPLPEEAPRRNA